MDWGSLNVELMDVLNPLYNLLDVSCDGNCDRDVSVFVRARARVFVFSFALVEERGSSASSAACFFLRKSIDDR